METISVLLVEDSKEDLLQLKKNLEIMPGKPVTSQETSTLESAVSLLSHYDFDVVLLDLFLPDSTGVDTVRRIISECEYVAVIVMTDVQDEEIASHSVRYGAMDYLDKKQLTPLLLRKAIHYAMERKQLLLEKEDLLFDLSLAYKKLEAFEGILPLCVSCKKILNDATEWQELEDYLSACSDTEVMKLLCPECQKDI